MNKQRRQLIKQIVEILIDMQAQLEDVLAQEQEAFDALPESIQDSDRGQDMQDYITNLEDVCNALQDKIDILEEIINN